MERVLLKEYHLSKKKIEDIYHEYEYEMQLK